MERNLRALGTCLMAIGLMGAQCSDSSKDKQETKRSESAINAGGSVLKSDMVAVAAAVMQKSPREQTFSQVEALVSKHDEDALLAFVADKYRELDPVPSRRIVSHLAEAGYKKFGSAKWQYYHALYVGTGVDTPPDPARALEILDQPATGAMRSSLTLRAKMLMRLGSSSNAPEGKVEELLKQAAAQGDGEAKVLLEKLGVQN